MASSFIDADASVTSALVEPTSGSISSHTRSSIVAGSVLGGVATIGIIALAIYLYLHRRRQQHKEEEFGTFTDTEKWSYSAHTTTLTWTPYSSRSDLRPFSWQKPNNETIGATPHSPASARRPVIKVITNLPPLPASLSLPLYMEREATPKSEKAPKSPKWKLKRVPVPRLSKLPPTPVFLAAVRRSFQAPRNLRRTLSAKYKGPQHDSMSPNGRPASLRLVQEQPPLLLATPTYPYLSTPTPAYTPPTRHGRYEL